MPFNLPSHPTILTRDSAGFRYDETSDEWNALCASLPCFAGLHWPDYNTRVIENVTVPGVPGKFIIQLWKGWCPHFIGLPNLPGGIGGEVGVYQRIHGKALPTSINFLPLPIQSIFTKAFSTLPLNQFWWPVTNLPFEIEFHLTNPINGNLFFATGPRHTWWRNKWMFEDSYAKYKQSQGRRWRALPWWIPGNARVPTFETGYQMHYSINGQSYPPW